MNSTSSACANPLLSEVARVRGFAMQRIDASGLFMVDGTIFRTVATFVAIRGIHFLQPDRP